MRAAVHHQENYWSSQHRDVARCELKLNLLGTQIEYIDEVAQEERNEDVLELLRIERRKLTYQVTQWSTYLDEHTAMDDAARETWRNSRHN